VLRQGKFTGEKRKIRNEKKKRKVRVMASASTGGQSWEANFTNGRKGEMTASEPGTKAGRSETGNIFAEKNLSFGGWARKNKLNCRKKKEKKGRRS